MTLKAPRAGERILLFPPAFERTFYEQSFVYEDGRQEVYRLFGYEKKPSVLIFPITQKRGIVAVRQFRHGSNDFIIEFPGGGSPTETKTIEQVGAEELLEETGYQAEEIINPQMQSWIDPSSANGRISFLIGCGCVKVADPHLDKNEIMETLVIPVKNWYEMIWRGEILDHKTLALSLFGIPFLEKGLIF